MLLEAPGLRKGLLGTLRPDRRKEVEDIAHEVSRQVTSYVLGTIALSLMFGVVIFVTLIILGVPFALLIGVVGRAGGDDPTGRRADRRPCRACSSPCSTRRPPASSWLIVFVGFQLVENHFIYPVVMSRSVRMNPLWVLLAVLVGANLGGVFGSSLGALAGALVAIPVGGPIQVIFREVWNRTRPQPSSRSPCAGAAGEGPPPRLATARPGQRRIASGGRRTRGRACPGRPGEAVEELTRPTARRRFAPTVRQTRADPVGQGLVP